MLPLAQCRIAARAAKGLVGLSVLILTVPSVAAAGDLTVVRPALVETYIPTEQAAVALPSLARAAPIKPVMSRPALRTADGFGLYAAVKGQGVDMTQPAELMNGPNGALFDEAAGLGWRRRNLSAMVGYMRPDSVQPVYQDESLSYRRARGRVGIGLSLHY